ncbi:AzlC family ABC transporter permease [Ramlibacter tataouinensis]|uniref:Candidate branched chain amino acid permease, azaleucine resistance n=1 Tax=Ramlibacter tataouinensis (strain ATCC BAA-407 / DSM 14655 / LMG 21543 / TTB310) TaxID=365046 RepID=F5Y236_RAMTT|nr:AzlC family ABC transporter permease [Ramlibacter tataouinensis]AEG94804.1 Candidate branched chain amino acid permease, azaleucine resistance [Ramlibacter tataouinensis TTB310]
MFFVAALRRHPEFRVGMRQMAPQAPGIAAWGLMTGVAMVKSGLSVTESLLMSVLVFAGSSQLASLPLIIAGAPAWVILATGFCVNLRFVVFSLHLRPYLMHLPRRERLVHGYLTADLSYVIFTRRFPQPAQDAAGRRAQEAFLAGNCAVNWASWVGASVVGVALANFIPTHWGLGFAGILCLVGILCSLASTRLRIVSASVAGAAAVVAYTLPLKLNIVVAIAVAVLLCLGLEKHPRLKEAAP